MIFSKSQLARIEESYKNVIDPRKSFENGIHHQNKVKLTEIEKMMSKDYIPEGENGSDSDEDETKM